MEQPFQIQVTSNFNSSSLYRLNWIFLIYQVCYRRIWLLFVNVELFQPADIILYYNKMYSFETLLRL